jgi:hypothetical protein
MFFCTGDIINIGLTQFMADNGLSQILNSSTRDRRTLGVCLTNRIDPIDGCEVICSFSDHLTLIVNCTTMSVLLVSLRIERQFGILICVNKMLFNFL